MANLVARVEATEKVMARFRGKAFDWTQRRTCIHLARAQARALGHRPPAVPDFRSSRAARAALKATGHASLAALLDSLFLRIPPATMWVGDLAIMEGGEDFDAIVISAGGKLIGYHADHLDAGIVNIVPVGLTPFVGAWRL